MHTLRRIGIGAGLAARVDRWALLFAVAVLLVVSGTVRGIVRNLDAAAAPPPEPPAAHPVRPLARASR